MASGDDAISASATVKISSSHRSPLVASRRTTAASATIPTSAARAGTRSSRRLVGTLSSDWLQIQVSQLDWLADLDDLVGHPEMGDLSADRLCLLTRGEIAVAQGNLARL